MLLNKKSNCRWVDTPRLKKHSGFSNHTHLSLVRFVRSMLGKLDMQTDTLFINMTKLDSTKPCLRCLHNYNAFTGSTLCTDTAWVMAEWLARWSPLWVAKGVSEIWCRNHTPTYEAICNKWYRLSCPCTDTCPHVSPTRITSTVYWRIASKLKALRNLYWKSNMFLWVEIFLVFVCYHVVPKRHSQLDYELSD